ncbi:MAG: bifunctional folylpolyglutamate synthase/dihydrofolate synthase [Armatimonadetes bacterium]|nr:bifunctional folylpolyglutamate synthase/dihydrofolate synthase [Armatimonadota bacterium]
MDYHQAQDYIASLAPRGWRLGLDRMAEFARRVGLTGSLGDGEEPKYIHVAGTNGKGSVTAMVQSCLIEQGYRTGSFYSPYVVDPRERVQFNREMISEADLAAIATDLMPIGESLSETDFGGVTEFEFKTALGFEFWKRKQCEWVALEVGLGGRLDATNIIEPAASAIVSISFDHTHILGDTLGKIAYEKAGIIKPGKPVVVGQMPDEAFREIEKVAKKMNAPLWKVGKEVTWEATENGVRICTPGSTVEVKPSLFGEIQLHNAAVAYAALEMAGAIRDPGKIQDGFAHAYLPGRFQLMEYGGKRFLCDGAHNADSAKVLSHMLKEADFRPKVCITGMLTGHSPEDFYGNLRGLVNEFYVTPIDFHRSMNPKELHESLKAMGFRATNFHTVKAAIDAACQVEDTEDILICGSFYLVGEAMRLLQSR